MVGFTIGAFTTNGAVVIPGMVEPKSSLVNSPVLIITGSCVFALLSLSSTLVWKGFEIPRA